MSVPKIDIRYVICLTIIGLLLGISIGEGIGTFTALDWGINKALWFLELKGVKIDMNAEQIIWGIQQYKQGVEQCWYDRNLSGVKLNASVFNVSGN